MVKFYSKIELVYKFFCCSLVLGCVLFPFKGSSFDGKNHVINASNKPSILSTVQYRPTTSSEKKFIWFRTPKAATNTIRTILMQNYPRTLTDRKMDIGEPFDRVKYANYFKFAFVRNPWDRVVSTYFNKIVTKKHQRFKECFDKSFEYFVDYLNKLDLCKVDVHIKLQTQILPVNDLDFIGRLENFEEDIQYVAKVLDLQILKIPKKNKTTHLHYSKYYTDRTKKIIAKKYKKDIETFGYQFEKE